MRSPAVSARAGLGGRGKLVSHAGIDLARTGLPRVELGGLNGRPIKRDIEALLEREVRITNDANCFALSKATDGAGKGAEVCRRHSSARVWAPDRGESAASRRPPPLQGSGAKPAPLAAR